MTAQKSSSYTKLQKIFIVCMISCISCFLVLLLCGNTLSQTDIILLSGQDFQADTLKTELYTAELNPYGFSESETHVPFPHANYLPLAYLYYYSLYQISGRDILSVQAETVSILCMVFAAALLFFLLWKLFSPEKKGWLPACLCILSAPSVFAFERGNLIYLTSVLIAFFLLFYRSENLILRELSFLCLAVAAAFKVFPALFGLLLLSEQRWKEAFRLLLYGLGAAFLPFFFIQGGFRSIPCLFENVKAHTAFYSRYVFPRFGFRLFSSLFMDIHWENAFLENTLWKIGIKMERFFPAINIILSCCCLLTVLFDLPLWKKTAALAAVLINYPVNSGLYTALYFLPVIMLFLKEEPVSFRNSLLLLLFLLILSPIQVPIPYSFLGIQDPVLCNLTNICQNFAAFLIFLIFAWTGVRVAFRTVRASISLQNR